MKHPISCETWNMKLNQTSSYAPSWILLLSSLTTATSLVPQLLFGERGGGTTKQTELGFARLGYRPNVNLKQNADTHSLTMEVFIFWWLLTCYLYHSDVPASRAHAWWGTRDAISTELRMSSMQKMLGVVLGRYMISVSWAQISTECFNWLLWTHKLAWIYLWLFSIVICYMVYICHIQAY